MPDNSRSRPWLIIGCGSIGRRHLANARALGIRAFLAVDPREERRRDMAEHFGVPTFARLDEAWASQPHVAVIATPPSTHLALAQQAAEHDCHLFVEKPLADRGEGVEQLIDIAKSRRLIAMVGCNLRFHPALLQVQRLICEGVIGQRIAVRAEVGQYLPDWHPREDYRHGYSAQRALGGGIILDAIHELDYLRWLLGEVEAVTCFAGKLSRLEIDTEDTAALLLRFAGGLVGEVHLDYVQRAPSRTGQLIGDEGTIRWDLITGEVRWYTAADRQWHAAAAPSGWTTNQMYLDELRQFVRCLAGDERPAQDLANAARVLDIALAAKRSAESGQLVLLPSMPRGAAPRVVAIVQARLMSQRLPGKVLADISGHPMLWHVVERARHAHLLDEVVVATSTTPADDAIAAFCAQEGIACFRGSEEDVLDRFYHAAQQHRADTIVRITADCPFIDPVVVDQVITTFHEGNCDYASNVVRGSCPDGLDAEVFSSTALHTAWRDATLPADREHVTPYLRTSGRFRVQHVDAGPATPDLRWTVDEPADLEFARAVYARLGARQPPFSSADVLRLLAQEPQLSAVNAGTMRNEGFYRSLAAEPALPPHERMLTRSIALHARAEQLIPAATQTFSKGPTQFVQGVAPVFLARGQGSHVWDVDGNEYIDYPMALGPVILGYNDPAITEAVERQLRDGTTFSLPHPLEVDVAEQLTELIPCAEMVRFGKNGSDATSGAVRLARAVTGREHIAMCGYHGWQDWSVGTTTRNAGVPDAVRALTDTFQYNNLDSLQCIFDQHRGQVAAVIMEPVGLEEPRDHFLQRVQELARREGALLIFDEVLTGFRLALGGAQEYFGVTPDLACFGKAMANGFPLSAIVGRRDLMRQFEEVFFSFTFGGETLSLAAAAATLTTLREQPVLETIWSQGRRLQDGYRRLAQAFGMEHYTQCLGLPPRTVVTFTDQRGTESLLLKSLFQQECLKRGVLFAGGHNLCYSHAPADVDQTLRVYRAALDIVAAAIHQDDVADRLEGEPVQPVFRRA